MNIIEFTRQMNFLGHMKVPFLFVVDFEMEKPLIIALDDVDADQILFDVNGLTNAERLSQSPGISMRKYPISRSAYETKFFEVFRRLSYGDSYLTNLTIRTEITVNRSLREIFHMSAARYKVLFEDQFLVFSPETFVRIKDGKIHCHPMKGTIDAAIPDAAGRILRDRKEMSEHVTITDLIRNDLSRIAASVQVSRFRYVDSIKTNGKTLLQISSEIEGRLASDYLSGLGDILVGLLPAGSVSGAPKIETLEIIKSVEQRKRGYYTGVFGIFDGNTLDSGVMIRYIEKEHGNYFYHSGGGITTQSEVASEYQEAIDKVYVPLN